MTPTPSHDPATPAGGVEHTPGPWRLTSDAGHPTNARITSTARRHIAKVYAEDAGPDPECKANARLIAAAPDYHAAVSGNLDLGEQYTCGPLAWLREAISTLLEPEVMSAAEGDDPDAYQEMLTELQRLHGGLRAAIAKATGTALLSALPADGVGEEETGK